MVCAAVLPAARGQRPYISVSAVQTDKTKESMVELVKEYKGIVGGKPITSEELKDEQSNTTLGLPGHALRPCNNSAAPTETSWSTACRRITTTPSPKKRWH